MKMRKLIFTLTAVVITVSMLLSGCSGSEKPVEPGVTDEVTVPDEVVSGEPVVINYFTSRAPTDDTISAIQQIVEQYNMEGNNIELVIDTAADRASYDQKLRTMVAADKMPTLFDLDPTPYAKELGDSGKLVDMEAFLKEAGIFDDYISVSIEYQRLPDGRIFGLPLEFTTEMTWYNVDIFNKYNLVPPKTFDEWLSVSKTLAENGVTPIAIDGVDGWPLMRYVAMKPFRMTGNQYLTDLSTGDAKMSDAPGVATAEFIAEIGQYFQTGFSSTDYTTAKDLFLAGKTAMYGIGTWELQNFLPENLPAGLHVDYFYMPMVENSVTTENEYWAFGGIGLAASQENFDENVKAFLEYLVKNYDEKYLKLQHFPPRSVEIQDVSEFSQLFLDIQADQAKFGETATKPWDVLLPADVNTTLADNLVALAMGQLSVDEFVQIIDKSLEENIK